MDAGESLTSDADSVSGGDPEATGSMVSSSMSENSSFPVDIVVVIRVQPSEIRFSCLPVSRVECMLNLPDLDVVFSSNSSPNKYLQQASNRPPSRDQASETGFQKTSSYFNKAVKICNLYLYMCFHL